MIVHQLQPTPHSCGQTVLAMLLGVPVAQVLVDIPDSKRGTSYGQLRAYLTLRGWRTSRPRRLPAGHVLPQPSIIRLVSAGKRTRSIGHWVLLADGAAFDPGNARFPFAWILQGARPVSFIACAPPERTA